MRKYFSESERINAIRESRKKYYLKHKHLWNLYAKTYYQKKKKRLGLSPIRSKEENIYYLKIRKEFPNFKIVRNTRDIIRSPLTGYPLELDIYIPRLKLAFEINGINHRKPTRGGLEKFEKRKLNDSIKLDQCEKMGISLTVINV